MRDQYVRVVEAYGDPARMNHFATLFIDSIILAMHFGLTPRAQAA